MTAPGFEILRDKVLLRAIDRHVMIVHHRDRETFTAAESKRSGD